jgi:hypothetical protein
MWDLWRRLPAKPKNSRRRVSRRDTPSHTRLQGSSDRIALGSRAEVRPAIIADVGHPRGSSLAHGLSRIEFMVAVAMIGRPSTMAAPHLLGELPTYGLSSAVRAKELRADDRDIRVVGPPVRPATRSRCMVSRASARLITGGMVVRRRARIDVPAPGGPRRRRLWSERLHRLYRRTQAYRWPGRLSQKLPAL